MSITIPDRIGGATGAAFVALIASPTPSPSSTASNSPTSGTASPPP